MSFLSTLFCCFDAEESGRREDKITTPRTKLSKTQSNLQKALTNTSINTKNLSSTENIDNYNSRIEINSIDNNSIKLKNNSTTTNNAISNNNNNNNNNKTSKTNDNNINNKTKDMSYAESNSTNNAKEIIEEITDLKDSTDSSKNEDDIINIDGNQTENNNEDGNYNKKKNDDNNNNNNDDDNNNNNNNDDNNNENDENHNDNYNYNDISINNNNDEEQQQQQKQRPTYDNQFGLDLSEILSNQAVSNSGWLLDKKSEKFKGKKCLVLDLDETLVHSSFKYVRQCDFVIPVEIENQVHNVYVIKRPGVDEFLKRVGEIFEVVVFTASVSRYGDPLLDILDSHKSVHHRLFRDSCYNYQGNYIKNLSQMGRPLEDLIIIDNSPASYVFHPQHAVPISSWFSDSHDCELTDLLPFLEDLATNNVDDIRLVLDINI